MIDKHRIENEGWINARKEELKEERKQLEIDKVSVPLFLLFFGRRWSGKLRYRCLLPLERWRVNLVPRAFPSEKIPGHEVRCWCGQTRQICKKLNHLLILRLNR